MLAEAPFSRPLTASPPPPRAAPAATSGSAVALSLPSVFQACWSGALLAFLTLPLPVIFSVITTAPYPLHVCRSHPSFLLSLTLRPLRLP